MGRAGEPTTDADRAVITNRNTGYRWILRRGRTEVEFQTMAMYEDLVADQGIEVYLTVEEAEALARSAMGRESKDAREKALTGQALDQIAHLCRGVRDCVTAGDTDVARRSGRIPRARPESAPVPEVDEDPAKLPPRPPYRPLGDPDNLSFKEAGEILGKARNTLHGWYRTGRFPPAVDVGPFLHQTKPVLVVPRYRLEAWQSDERMPSLFQEIFQRHRLREFPWGCWSVRRGASKLDVDFWIERRALEEGRARGRKRIYGHDLEVGVIYELVNDA